MSGSRRMGVLVVVVVAAAAAVMAAPRSRGCTWGTFSYSVRGRGGTENTDLAVRREGREVVITRDGLAARSTLSPDAARVALESAEGGSFSDTVGYSTLAIHVADVDGSGRESLTSGPFDERPRWAPDGAEILFLRERGVWTVDVETKEEELVYTPPSTGTSVVDAAWSGDSSRIAFFLATEARGDGEELWVVDVDGSHPRRLVTLGDGGVGELAWSPNGQTFAWTAFEGEVGSVVVMPTALGTPRVIEPNAQTPVWSRDSAKLAYVSGRPDRDRLRVVIGDADADDPEQLPDSPQHIHDWVSC